MRTCLRCETPMVDNLSVVANAIYVVDVREAAGLFERSLGKIKCAVCPECGYTETYMENPEKIKKLAKKTK